MSSTTKQEGLAKHTPVDRLAANLYAELERRETRLGNLLPPGHSVERFKEGFRFALAAEPKLLKCTPSSLLIAVMRAAKLGIDVAGGALGHGFLVPYGEECQLVPGYKGLVALAVYAGVVQDMTPVLVYERDEFQPDEGTGAIGHKPYVVRRGKDGKPESRGEVIAAYTRVLLPSGLTVHKGLLYLDDLERIQASVKAAKSPWFGPHKGEMQKKSTIRNAFKTLGVPEAERAERLREALRADAEAELLDVQVEQQPGRAPGAAGLRASLGLPATTETDMDRQLREVPKQREAAPAVPDAEEQEEIKRREAES